MEQLSFFNTKRDQKKYISLLEGSSQVFYWENFLDQGESLLLYTALKEKVAWREDKITIFGKTHPVPRLQAWYADSGRCYTYSKIEMSPVPWFEQLLYLRKSVEMATGKDFNSALVNYYRDGQDYVAWHSDDEKELGDRPVIASVSLGEKRKFFLRNKQTKEKLDITLADGSLLLMMGKTQKEWEHQLPRSKKINQGRINCTFRYIY